MVTPTNGNRIKGPPSPQGKVPHFINPRAKASWITTHLRIETHPARQELQKSITLSLKANIEQQNLLGLIMGEIETLTNPQERFELGFIFIHEIMSNLTQMLNQAVKKEDWQLAALPIYIENKEPTTSITIGQNTNSGKATVYLEEGGVAILPSTRIIRESSSAIPFEAIKDLLVPQNSQAVYYHPAEGATLQGAHFEIFPTGRTFNEFGADLLAEKITWDQSLEEPAADALINAFNSITHVLIRVANRTPALGCKHYCYIKLMAREGFEPS